MAHQHSHQHPHCPRGLAPHLGRRPPYRCLSAPVRAVLTAITGAGLWIHRAEWWLCTGAIVAAGLALLDIVPACRPHHRRLATA